MYIPELDAIIFLATEYVEGSPDQPTLTHAREALHQAAGATMLRQKSTSPALKFVHPSNLLQAYQPQDDIKPTLWEALGGARDVSLTTVALLLTLVCQADFEAKAAFVFWLLDKDSDHKVTKGDVISAIGPLMHTAQAGMVFMGSSGGPGGNPQKGTSIWEDFRDSMRELATDQMAAAIANGAFDEVDAQHTGKIHGQQFRAMIECIATDVATMMADMTDLQFQAEQASGERLDSNHGAATGVKAALHKLVKKYAGDETAERLLGAPAKARRKSEMSATRRSRLGLGSSLQQSSRLSSMGSQTGQLQQQPHRPPPGPRFTSTPTLASQTGFSPHGAEHSTSGLPAPFAQEGGSAGWGNASQQLPYPSSYLNQQRPSQSSNVSQGSLDEGSGDRHFMPTQTSIPFRDRSLSQQPATGDQQPQAAASRTLQFSDSPLLGPSTSNASQPAHDLGADTGVGQSGWGAYQQAQPLQAEQMPAASTSRTTQDADAGPSSHSQEPNPGRFQGQSEQGARTESGMLRQGWFQNDLYSDDADPNLHNPRDPDLDRKNSHAQASPSSSPSPKGPVDLRRMSQQVNLDLQAEEEARTKLRQARMERANRAAAAAHAAIKADLKAMDDAQKESQIDPKHALITLVAGVAVRYYLMDVIKLLIILAILLGDASFVAVLYIRSNLSLELSLGIVFFVNMVLAVAILIYIATGVNTDIFYWIKDYAQSLKEDDSAVNAKKDSTLMKLAAMEGAVPKQLQPTFKKVMQRLQQVGKKGKPKQADDSDSESSFRRRSHSQYSDVHDDGAGQKSPYSPLGALSRLSRGSRGGRNVSFARRSSRGVSQRRPQGKEKKGKEKPEDYMSKAKQLWTYVGKFTGLETAEGSEASGTGQDFSPASGHSRSFGQWGSNNSRTSRPRPGPSRLGRAGSAAHLRDDYKSAVMLARAEEGDAEKQPVQQTSVRIDSITQQQ